MNLNNREKKAILKSEVISKAALVRALIPLNDSFLTDIVIGYFDAGFEQLKNDLEINESPKLIMRPSLRRGNKRAVTIEFPIITGYDKNNFFKWTTKSKRVIVEETTAKDVVAEMITTGGVFPPDLMAHCYLQARKLCYLGPSQAINDSIHRLGVGRGMCLTSKRVEVKKNLYQLVMDSTAKEIVQDILDINPAVVFALEAGLRPTRLVYNDFIPFRAVLLRQYLHSCLAKSALK